MKHNGPLLRGELLPASFRKRLPRFPWDLELHSFCRLEAQIAALADDIAYVSHDIDDGLRAGLFGPRKICSISRWPGQCSGMLLQTHPGLELGRLIGESVRRIITRLVSDLISETERRLKHFDPRSAVGVRHCVQPVMAGLSADLAEAICVSEAVPFRAYVPPSTCFECDAKCANPSDHPFRSTAGRIPRCCRTTGVAGAAPPRPRDGARGVRLYRRNDRSLCRHRNIAKSSTSNFRFDPVSRLACGVKIRSRGRFARSRIRS